VTPQKEISNTLLHINKNAEDATRGKKKRWLTSSSSAKAIEITENR